MSGHVEDPTETSMRRRRIVALLDGVETPATVDQLVDRLETEGAARTRRPGREPSWETLHELLVDEDLPALDRAGLLTFDQERGIVTQRGPETEVVAVDSWGANAASQSGDGAAPDRRVAPYVLLVIAGVSLGLLALTALDVGPFARVADQLLSAALVVLLSLLSVVNALWG